MFWGIYQGGTFLKSKTVKVPPLQKWQGRGLNNLKYYWESFGQTVVLERSIGKRNEVNSLWLIVNG